jgi:hypothetical protein
MSSNILGLVARIILKNDSPRPYINKDGEVRIGVLARLDEKSKERLQKALELPSSILVRELCSIAADLGDELGTGHIGAEVERALDEGWWCG